jgi:hypothetical protein
MKFLDFKRRSGLAVLLLLSGLFYACNQADSPAGPADPDPDPDPTPTCETDSTLCLNTNPDPTASRNCVTDPVVFTEYLIDPSVVSVLGEIGSVAAKTEIGGRSYIFPKSGQDGQRLELKVPADMYLTGIRHYRPIDAPVGYRPDWSLALKVGCGIWLEVYHVKDIPDSIKALVDTTIGNASAWQALSTPIALKAGQTLGWYIPGPNAVSFDFIAHNDSITNQFVNQPRYLARNSNILDIVCPYDLFEPTKKAAYYALLGTGTGTLAPGANCGTPERDVIGTPAGQWFFDSGFVTAQPVLLKDGYYGEPLPLIIAADSTMLVGHIGPADDFRIPRSNPTWKNLDDITTDWCYQTYTTTPTSVPVPGDGWLWLKMETTTKMKVAYSPTGSCPSTFPDSGFKTYYR